MMTKVEEISEAEFASQKQEKIKEITSLDDINDDDYTDVGSEESDLQVHDESVFERISALIDIIPPVTRVKAMQALEDVGEWSVNAFRFIGSGMWIISTASILTIFPLALELEREGAVIEQETAQRNQATKVAQAEVSFTTNAIQTVA